LVLPGLPSPDLSTPDMIEEASMRDGNNHQEGVTRPFDNPASQEERLSIVQAEAKALKQAIDKAREPAIASTYFAQAAASAEQQDGTATVTGASTVVLPVPSWCVDPVPAEPPLGIDVNAVPDLGFPEGRRGASDDK
jgi:hypothetical protein